MQIRQHSNYRQLVARARSSHAHNRSPVGITDGDIDIARLYCYAFRLHTIGAFHATKAAIEQLHDGDEFAATCRQRAIEALTDLANLAMESVPDDFAQ